MQMQTPPEAEAEAEEVQPRLHAPCIVCDMVLTEERPVLQLKSMYGTPARYFSVSMSDCVVFQRLTPEERIILDALDSAARQDREWLSDTDSDDELTDDGESASASDLSVSSSSDAASEISANWDVIPAGVARGAVVGR